MFSSFQSFLDKPVDMEYVFRDCAQTQGFEEQQRQE